MNMFNSQTISCTPKTASFRNHLAAPATYLLLGLLTLLFLAPIALMVVGSLKPDDLVLIESGSLKGFFPDTVSLHNYRDVFARVNFSRFLFNSLFINTTIVAAGVCINSVAAYAFARLQWPGTSFSQSYWLL